jgi:hypothetical protein
MPGRAGEHWSLTVPVPADRTDDEPAFRTWPPGYPGGVDAVRGRVAQ